mgnify:CR=1 FL=1
MDELLLQKLAKCPVLWAGMNANGDGFRKGGLSPSLPEILEIAVAQP